MQNGVYSFVILSGSEESHVLRNEILRFAQDDKEPPIRYSPTVKQVDQYPGSMAMKCAPTSLIGKLSAIDISLQTSGSGNV
jgi:hypothetical protein